VSRFRARHDARAGRPQTDTADAAFVARSPSAVLELNRALAVAMADGPAPGLQPVEAREASEALAGYHLPLATRTDPLRRLNRHAGAPASHREALALAATDAKRRYLARRPAETTRQG